MSLSTIKNAHKGATKDFRIKNLKELTPLESTDIYGKELTVDTYDVAKNDNGFYVVIMFKEIPNSFYFGKSVATALFQEIEMDEDAVNEVLSGNLKIKFVEATSQKTGRKYENVIIID